MARSWVVNTSPLILLAKIGQISLLSRLSGELIIPAGVVAEIYEGPEDDTARDWIASEGAIFIRDAGQIPLAIASWDLGKGESEVLTWAVTNAGFQAVVDDRAARNCGAALQVPIIGTLGVLLLAKKERHIAAVGPLFDALIEAGLRINHAVLSHALLLAGER